MNEEAILSETVNGFTVRVIYDEDPENPRNWDGNLGLMLCNHPRYDLGDDKIDPGEHESLEALLMWLRETYDPTVIMPLYLLDHSGLSIRTGNPIPTKIIGIDANNVMSRSGRFVGDGQGWDTSLVGFILDTAKSREEVYYLNDIQRCLESEVELYDQYLRGEAYGYVITAPDGRDIDACFGFFDEPETVLKEHGLVDLEHHTRCSDCEGTGHGIEIIKNTVKVTHCPHCERFESDEAAARDVLTKLGGGVLELTIDPDGTTTAVHIKSKPKETTHGTE